MPAAAPLSVHAYAPIPQPAAMRTGADYLESLNDGRRVFVDGKLVDNVAEHPALREAARSIARLFDIAADPANRERMTFPSPDTGAPVWRCYDIPKTAADLKARRLFSETWAEATFGLMGRGPDHVANFFTGYAAVPGVFAAGGQKFADNLLAFHRRMRDEYLYLSYAIVPPQIDRSKPAHQQSDPTLHAGVIEERADGIVVSGAQQLATGGPLSDYIQISSIIPLQAGDENYANNFVVPANAPGLTLYPRRPFAAHVDNDFDHPLSSRFDETDAFVVLDKVFVPWEHVFVYRNIQIARDQWWKTTAHALGNHQAQTRYVTKLRFLAGMAQKMNEMTGHANNPPVMVQMGELAAFASIYDSLLQSHEAMATVDADGVLWPARTSLYAASCMQSEFNGRVLEIVREMAGSAFITLPSSVEDFDHPQAGADIARYMRSASTGAKERVALMRMLWDFIGSEFGSRHAQYEKFYGGAPFVVKMNMFRNFDFKRATALVDKALALPPTKR